MGYWKSDYDFSQDIIFAVQADYDAKVAREIAESESEAEQAALEAQLEAQLAEEQAQCVDYQKSEIADYLKNQLDVAYAYLYAR